MADNTRRGEVHCILPNRCYKQRMGIGEVAELEALNFKLSTND